MIELEGPRHCGTKMAFLGFEGDRGEQRLTFACPVCGVLREMVCDEDHPRDAPGLRRRRILVEEETTCGAK